MRLALSVLVAAAATGGLATPVPAQEWPFGLGNSQDGAWSATVSGAPQVADPSWSTVVLARRASAIETASLADTRLPVSKPGLTGPAHKLTGMASFYGPGVGPLTASGEAFDKSAMTAAHRTLPMGSKVKVTNVENGRSVMLRINDRGPFVAGRVIDVSEAAADVLGMRHAGVAKVKVEPVGN